MNAGILVFVNGLLCASSCFALGATKVCIVFEFDYFGVGDWLAKAAPYHMFYLLEILLRAVIHSWGIGYRSGLDLFIQRISRGKNYLGCYLPT